MIDCPETSVNNYHYRLRDSPEERRSYFTSSNQLIIILLSPQYLIPQCVYTTVKFSVLNTRRYYSVHINMFSNIIISTFLIYGQSRV